MAEMTASIPSRVISVPGTVAVASLFVDRCGNDTRTVFTAVTYSPAISLEPDENIFETETFPEASTTTSVGTVRGMTSTWYWSKWWRSLAVRGISA